MPLDCLKKAKKKKGGKMPHPKIVLNNPRLEVITGCMFAGKSEELALRLSRYPHAGKRVILLRPERDTRGKQTHSGKLFDGKEVIVPTNITLEVLMQILGEKQLKILDVIGIDEGNFFDNSLVQLCNDLVKLGKIIIVAGLDLTFAEEGYGPMPKLMLLAEVVDKLTAVCSVCGSPYANRTQRLVDGKPASKESPRDIVGDETARKTPQGIITYEARCRKCYVPPR